MSTKVYKRVYNSKHVTFSEVHSRKEQSAESRQVKLL